MTWGRSAACDGCKLRRTHLVAELGVTLEGFGECHDNGGGNCLYPQPIPPQSLAALWRIWVDSNRLAMGADLNGNLVLDMGNLAQICAAHGEIVDETFLRRFSVMFEALKKVQEKKRKK